MNSLYFSRNFRDALTRSTVDMMSEVCNLKETKLKEVADASGEPIYYVNNICTEFHVGACSVRKFDEAFKSIVSTKVISSSGLSSTSSTNDEKRFVRLLLRDRIPAVYSKIVSYTIDSYSCDNVFIVVTSSTGNVDATLRSRLMPVNCNFKVASCPSSTFSLVETQQQSYDTHLSHPHCDAFIGNLLDQALKVRLSHGSSSIEARARLFELVHTTSYKLCGTMASVDLICRSCMTVLAPKAANLDASCRIVEHCAKADAMRRSVNKPSLLFDYLLFACLSELTLGPPTAKKKTLPEEDQITVSEPLQANPADPPPTLETATLRAASLGQSQAGGP